MLAGRINNIIAKKTATFKWYDKQLEVIDKICLQTLMIIIQETLALRTAMIIMIIIPKKR
jgi:hypothetical protein